MTDPPNQLSPRKSSLLSAQQNPIILNDSYKIDIVPNPTDIIFANRIKDTEIESLDERTFRVINLENQSNSVIKIDVNADVGISSVGNCEETPLSRNNSIRRRQKNERDPNVETVL